MGEGTRMQIGWPCFAPSHCMAARKYSAEVFIQFYGLPGFRRDTSPAAETAMPFT